ncbi:MAG: T9SS type A sorting domain-containing protein [Bacteroides sp.]|nr:T9SS type A sorting domain-containing protein [Ruminococcus flavefaciens]MCM1554871.1 T9SS type A sorting domain-containing protein [Bacteroides sp.]
MKTLSKVLAAGILFAGALCFGRAQNGLIEWCQPDTITKVSTANTGGIYVYTYDDRGNALVTEYFETNANGEVPQQKITAVYNRFDLVDTTVSYSYRNGAYMAAARKISTYDKRGNHITLTNENSGDGTIWVNASRYTYTYNEQGLKTATLVEVPASGFPDKWVNSQKADYAYDAQGREISYEQYVWNGTDWAHYRSTFNVYEGDLLKEESGKGLTDEGVFTDTYKIQYTYNAAGSETEWLYLVFEDGGWTNAYRRDFSYDETTGRRTEYVSYEWNTALSEPRWTGTTRETYFYNEKGLRYKVDQYAKVENAEEWSKTISVEYTFSAFGRRTSMLRSDYRDEGGVSRYEFELNGKDDDVRASCFEKKGEEWIPADRYDLQLQWHDGTEILYANSPAMHELTVHYASGIKTPVNYGDLANETRRGAVFAIRVYPNPARDVLRVETEEDGMYDIELFDISGRRLSARYAVSQAEFNVERFSGMCFVRVSKDGQAVSRKVVVL